MSSFLPEDLLPRRLYERVTQLRVIEPDTVLEAFASRRRRAHVAPDGRLAIIAADHPARGVTNVGDDAGAMARRHDFLARIIAALRAPGIDGIMSTMDVLEDLLLVDRLFRDADRETFLDRKAMVASLNRAGLAGAAWELDDPLTGATPEACAARNLDGAKLLLRVCRSERDCLPTIRWAADAIGELERRDLPTFLEPLPVERRDDRWSVVRRAPALADVVSIATGLGTSSRHVWLKLPLCDDFHTVAESTTCPILLLGGPRGSTTDGLVAEMESGLDAGHNVRGVMLGRRMLYPETDDPHAAAAAIGALVHPSDDESST